MNQQELPPAFNASRKSRRLKMSRTGSASSKADVPYLRLCGRWLKDAGLDIGRNVRIEVSAGRLMIETAD